MAIRPQYSLCLTSPALHVERHCYLEDGPPIEYTHTWYRGDSYDFLVELQRDVTPTVQG